MEPPPNITVTPALNEPSKGKQRDYIFFYYFGHYILFRSKDN